MQSCSPSCSPLAPPHALRGSTMVSILRALFARFGATRRPPLAREHLHLADWPSAIYAIGDIHGCHAQLRDLEALITADAGQFAGEKLLVCLGDYIDRGPDSAAVLDRLIAPPPPGFRRVCVAGNHEIMALDFLANPSPRSMWLEQGGSETLASYGLAPEAISALSRRPLQRLIDSHIPAEHIEFLTHLPATLSVPGFVFVHAGLRPGIALENQSQDDLFWIRDEFLQVRGNTQTRVVHGREPMVTSGRIGIDTGAFATGILTAVRLQPGTPPVFLATGPTPPTQSGHE
jgi:serine/threonine protein phosphatase 1